MEAPPLRPLLAVLRQAAARGQQACHLALAGLLGSLPRSLTHPPPLTPLACLPSGRTGRLYPVVCGLLRLLRHGASADQAWQLWHFAPTCQPTFR